MSNTHSSRVTKRSWVEHVYDRPHLILFEVFFVLISIVVIILVSADTGPWAAIETEKGTITGTATIVTNTAASGGKMIQFGTGTTTTPPPTTPPPSTTPTPTPTTSTKPTASNTGPAASVALQTITGDYTMKTDGENLSGKRITGTLYLAANNITVTDVEANYIGINTAPGGVYYNPAKSNQKLTRVLAGCMNNNGMKNVTLIAVHLKGCVGSQTSQLAYYNSTVQALTAENNDGLTIQDSFFEGQYASPNGNGTHLEALHLIGVTNVTITNNVFAFNAADVWTAQHITGAFTMEAGPFNENITIDGNWFYGGGYYQVYLNGRNLRVTNNKFNSWTQPAGTGYSMAGVQYPPSAYGAGKWTQLVDITGNTLDGQPFTLANPVSH